MTLLLQATQVDVRPGVQILFKAASNLRWQQSQVLPQSHHQDQVLPVRGNPRCLLQIANLRTTAE